MKYQQYRKLRQQTYERLMRARAAGARAAQSNDWRELVAACEENDAAYVADCRAQDMLRFVDDLPIVYDGDEPI